MEVQAKGVLHRAVQKCQGTRSVSNPIVHRPDLGNFGRNRLVVEAAAARKKPKASEGLENAPANIVPPEQKEAIMSRVRDIAKKLNKDFGEGTISLLENKPMPLERLSTGDPGLDHAIGGGYPKGRVTEIYGPASSGKSTLALLGIAQAQGEGRIAAYIDVENSFDPVYAARLGVNMNELILVSSAPCGEDALQIIDSLARDGIDLVVLDSVSGLVPKAEMEGDIKDQSMGLLARVLSKGLKYITQNVKKANTVVLLINQMRQNLAGYGGHETTTGGSAPKFFSSVRLHLKANKADLIKQGNQIVGQTIRVTVEKNKTYVAASRTTQLHLYYQTGLDTMTSLVEACRDYAVIDKKGNTYSLGNKKLGVGVNQVVQTVKQSPELELVLRQGLMKATEDPFSQIQNSTSDEDEEVDSEDGAAPSEQADIKIQQI